jgi:serine/threonine protein kinase
MLKELMDFGPYTEKESARLMRQLLEAICYMNSRGVAHRDLKPDNW